MKKMVAFRDWLSSFLMNSMNMSSNRVKLIWFSAFSWAGAHLWYGPVLSIAREWSKVYYKKHGMPILPADLFDLSSPYAQTILTSTDLAFTAIVVGYIASSWRKYGVQAEISKEVAEVEIKEKTDEICEGKQDPE